MLPNFPALCRGATTGVPKCWRAGFEESCKSQQTNSILRGPHLQDGIMVRGSSCFEPADHDSASVISHGSLVVRLVCSALLQQLGREWTSILVALCGRTADREARDQHQRPMVQHIGSSDLVLTQVSEFGTQIKPSGLAVNGGHRRVCRS